MAELRVVLAEDHYLVREGTRRLLEASGEIDVVAAVGTADELLDAARRLRPDVVVTDIRMPGSAAIVRAGMEGIDAAHRITGAGEQPRHPPPGRRRHRLPRSTVTDHPARMAPGGREP